MSLPFKKRILVTPSAAFSHKSISQHLEELIDFKADVTLVWFGNYRIGPIILYI
jgi:hypothetical protein